MKKMCTCKLKVKKRRQWLESLRCQSSLERRKAGLTGNTDWQGIPLGKGEGEETLFVRFGSTEGNEEVMGVSWPLSWSSGYYCRHHNGHQTHLYLEEHVQSRFSSSAFQGLPFQMCQHVRDGAFVAVAFHGESRSSSLHHLQLVVVFLVMGSHTEQYSRTGLTSPLYAVSLTLTLLIGMLRHINASCLLAFWVVLLICLLQVRFAESSTPRYVALSTFSRASLCNL